ncbi:hypothetical protein [Peribacillus tepidiphilus]|uniref:hypothetical protein n=1 Tax=Peribacillus tepidiphilus TaxID=2652445 RepID=UPI001292BAB6|nr:hypothetical protein [Peribacillus tepidiphilus]
MKTYEVHISLKNGDNYTFFKNAQSKEEIVNEVTNQQDNEWYHFITKSYVKYQVKKEEIVSIGISLSLEEAQEFEDTLNY